MGVERLAITSAAEHELPTFQARTGCVAWHSWRNAGLWPANWPCHALDLQRTGDHYVGKPSAEDQPTRPTQPFILSGSINEQWAAIRCSPPQSVEAPSGERLRGKAGIVFVAGKTVWSMPERFKVVCIPCKALHKCSALPLLKGHMFRL